MARMTRRTTKTGPRPFRDLALSMGATWYILEDSRNYDIGPHKTGTVDSQSGTQTFSQPPIAPGLGKSMYTTGGWLRFTGRDDQTHHIPSDFSVIYWFRPKTLVERATVWGYPHSGATYANQSIFHFTADSSAGVHALTLVNSGAPEPDQENLIVFDDPNGKNLVVNTSTMVGASKAAGLDAPIVAQDGSEELSTNAIGAALENSGQLHIGGQPSSFWTEFDGWISDLVFFHGKLLSAAEMAALYRAGQGQF